MQKVRSSAGRVKPLRKRTYCLRQANTILTYKLTYVNNKFNYSATAVATNLFGLILMPGPIVVATAQDLMY